MAASKPTGWAGSRDLDVCGAAGGGERAHGSTLGGVSLSLTAAPGRLAAATGFLHISDERGPPP